MANVERFFITTPIYYVNDVPHIGHAYSTLTADALARWHRLMGEDVFFLTGTDEHGLKVARAAEQNGLDPQQQADLTSQRFIETWELLDISYDDFIRTSDSRHHRSVQKFLEVIKDNGDIELGTYEGPYCVPCEAYYMESELIQGNCPIHKRPVESLTEENYFFKLSRYQQPLLDWYEAHPDAIQPESKRNEALGLIRQGLEDISISRSSISWGVAVPWDPKHVFYVWYDALINYVTAIGYGQDYERFNLWWPAVHHLIGKDILRFHCVYWPAMCMAAGIEPPPSIHVHGYLMVGGEKMSKTRLNQIAPADLVEDFGVEGFRYHFLRDLSFGPDGDFSYEAMVMRYNADLANNLGNLLARVATMVEKKCAGIGPAPRLDSYLSEITKQIFTTTKQGWDNFAPSQALEATWKLIKEVNSLFEATEPWKLPSGTEVEGILGDALESLRIVSILASPAIPKTCEVIWKRIGLDGSPLDQRLPQASSWGLYPGKLKVEKGAPLFPRKGD